MKNTSETTKRLNLKLNFILCLTFYNLKHELFDHLRYLMTYESYYGLTCVRTCLFIG